MVRPDCVDFVNLIAKGHGIVHKQLQELVRSRFAGQKFKLSVDCIDPGGDDDSRNL